MTKKIIYKIIYSIIILLTKINSMLALVLRNSNRIKRLDRFFYKKGLFYGKKWYLWRIEKARELGMKVGKNCRFYSLNVLSEPFLVEIGDNVIISLDVIFLTHDGGVFCHLEKLKNVRGNYGRIKIGNNCFIGARAMLLPDVVVGNNCVIGAGAVLSGKFPDNSVIMGNPGKVVYKTDMYLKLKKFSKNTVYSRRYPFPKKIDEKTKKAIIIERLMKK